MKNVTLLKLASLLIFFTTAVFAQTKTTNGSSPDWNTASAWTPSGVPNLGVDAVSVQHNMFLNDDINVTACGSLTVTGNATLTIDGKIDLGEGGCITNYITVDSGSTLIITDEFKSRYNNNLTVDGSFYVGDKYTIEGTLWTHNISGNVYVGDNFEVKSSGTVNITGGVEISGELKLTNWQGRVSGTSGYITYGSYDINCGQQAYLQCGGTNYGDGSTCTTPPAGGLDFSSCSPYIPPPTLFYEDFNEPDGPEAETFTGQDEMFNTNWTAALNGTAKRWRYKSSKWETENVYTESSKTTDFFNINSYTDLKLSMEIEFGDDLDCDYGDISCDEWVKVFYTVDTDTEQFLTGYYGKGSNGTYTTPLPASAVGSTISLRIEIHHNSNKDKHKLDNIKLTGVLDCSSASSEVTSAAANASNTQATVTWINPSANCITINEVLVVAKQGSDFSSATPSGSYTSSTTFGAGAAFDGGFVIYSNGTAQSVTVTGLTNYKTYYFKIFTKTGSIWSSGVSVSAVCKENLFFEDFEEMSPGSSSGVDLYGTPWSGTAANAFFFGTYVEDGDAEFYVELNSGQATWTTDPINISNYEDVNFSLDVGEYDDLESDDYIKTEYQIDGGAWTLAETNGNLNDNLGDGFDNKVSQGNLNGSTLKIKITVENDEGGNEEHFFDDILVQGQLKLPGCATNLAPTDTATDVSVTPTLSWDAVSGATGYKVFYGTDSSTTTALDETASTSVTLPTLPEGTLHYWKVVPTNARGDASGCSVISFTTETLIPDCATGLTPADGTTGVSITPELSWEAVSGATGYKVYYGLDISTTTALDETANTSVTLPTLQNGTQYYWKVVATNASGDATGCGNAISFTTIVAAPDCATELTPADGTTGVSITPELSWEAVSGATGYKVYYSSDSSDLGLPITLGEVTSYQLPQLGYETQYFWKVVPTNAGGEATGCSVISFTTLKNPAGSVFITGNTVTISKNAYLYLEKDFTNTGGSLTLNSSSTEFASIIVEGTASGNITYNRFVNYQAAGEWDIIGPPVLNQNMQSFAQTNTNNNTTSGAMAMGGDYYALGQYLTQWGSWVNYTTSTIPNANFPAAKGYQMGTNSIGSGNDMQGQTLAFTGEIATTTQTINIQNQNGANGGNGRRWNLVANPFSSYINGNTNAGATNGGTNFIDVNANVLDLEYTGLYYWDADEDGWDVFNQLQTNSDDGTLFIAPGQGFFVAARNSEVAQISFTPQMRTILGGDDFISGAPILLNYKLDLKLFNGSAERAKTKFHFQQGLTLGLDAGYDAGAYNQVTALSSRLPEDDQEVNFQLNAMNLESAYNQSIPLVINQEVGQNFRVSISNNTLPEDVNVYLEDTQNGTLTSLKDQDFELVAQSDLSDAGRFYIRFTTQNLAVNDVLSPSTINVYKINTDSFITIKGLTPEMGKTTATIYNMLGMKVRSKTLNNTAASQQISTQGLASGVYIINLRAGEQAISKKVIIQ